MQAWSILDILADRTQVYELLDEAFSGECLGQDLPLEHGAVLDHLGNLFEVALQSIKHTTVTPVIALRSRLQSP